MASNGSHETEEVSIAEALEELEELAEEDPTEALARFSALPEQVAVLAEFQLLRAALLRATGDPGAAKRLLQALVDADPDDADAHHLLGDVLEELDEIESAGTHFLETLRIDRLASRERDAEEIERVLDAALEYLQQTVEELPEVWRNRLAGVPLLVQRLPNEEMVRNGLDPRALGLFEGPMHVDTEGVDGAPLLTRIVLFAENLALDFPDIEDFKDQVRITVLHELGHYFGLDEDDMVRLGLD